MKIKNYKLKIKQEYRPSEIESKWRRIWEERSLYQPDIKKSKNPFYNLMMFPYPSALGLHVGNIYAFVGSDIYGRFKRMQHFDVFEPIGLDGFGIHSENFALKVGEHPMNLSKKTEKVIYAQLRSIGNGFDWSHKLETYVSDYYKWTQWIFIQLFKRGLAYRAEANVNWCPSCKTVLADEQVVAKRAGPVTTFPPASAPQPFSSKIDNPNVDIKSKKGWVRAVGIPSSRATRTTHYPLPATSFVCERCGTQVERRKLSQWFFRITDYAQRLLSGLDKIDWSEKVKIAQKNWLGKSEGILIKFDSDIESNTSVDVFTTRPDTLYGVTFMALAPEHPLVIKILEKSKGLLAQQIQKYVVDSLKKPESERIGLVEAENEIGGTFVKTGIKTGFHCTNPVNGKRVPIFIADYVVMSYGTGAIMGVPAHDQRDWDFAKKYHIDIVDVISGGDVSQKAFTGEGVLVNSDQFSGLDSQKAIEAITKYAVRSGFGEKKVMWHLRDWIISRQRYWGPPIPIIYCRKCWENGEGVSGKEAGIEKGLRQTSPTNETGIVTEKRNTLREGVDFAVIDGKEHWIHAVPEEDLPVELPYIKNFKPTHSTHSISSGQAGMGPLGRHPEFYLVKCPKCGSEARRETDVSDTFLDSSWYFLRYLATDIDWAPFPSKAFTPNSKPEARNPKQTQNLNVQNLKKFRNSKFEIRDFARRARWLPVDMYIGGAEHSVLHLLYSRFLTMAFYDMDLIDFEEPFTKFRAHGLLISEGAKMSKSRGNVVLPDPYIKKYGADTLRSYLMFCGRFDQGGDFRDTGIEGMSRFLKRIWRLVIANPKSEIRNTKQYQNSNDKNSKRLGHSKLENSNLFRASKFDIRNLSGEAAFIMHKTIKKVTEDIENLKYNTAISAIMEWVNFLEEKVVHSSQFTVHSKKKTVNREPLTRNEVENLLLLLAPFAPYMTEELYQFLGNSKFEIRNSNFQSIHTHPWPKYDAKLAVSDEIELVVQVNGKVRDRIMADRDIDEESAKAAALDLGNTQKYIAGRPVRKVIFVKGRLINFVV